MTEALYMVSNNRGLGGFTIGVTPADNVQRTLVRVPHLGRPRLESIGTMYHDSLNAPVGGYTFQLGNSQFEGGTGDVAFLDTGIGGLNLLGAWDCGQPTSAGRPLPWRSQPSGPSVVVWTVTTPNPYSSIKPLYLYHDCEDKGGISQVGDGGHRGFYIGDVATLFTGAGTTTIVVDVGENLRSIGLYVTQDEDIGAVSGYTVTAAVYRSQAWNGPLSRNRRRVSRLR